MRSAARPAIRGIAEIDALSRRQSWVCGSGWICLNAGVQIRIGGGDLLLEAATPPSSTVIDLLSRYKAEVMELLRPGADGRSTEDWQVFVDERAGGAEFDGGLRALEPPREMREVIVLADGDDSGEAAARDCALRWKREGRRVPIARPPHGMDFNDVLKTSAPLTEEDA
jgi:hypothetical protein